jgi:thioester reductase-like protein|nr:MAG TPA: hypothetical protein [Bacteriophage sp.]
MDEMNSAFDIEVSPKKENKEKQIQYKKYDKNKHNKGIVKEEIVESVKQELESVAEEEVKPIAEKSKLKEGWARGIVHSKWKTSAWVILENGKGLTMNNFGKYSIGETVEFELPSWYKDLPKSK